jgi:hypothetical protein
MRRMGIGRLSDCVVDIALALALVLAACVLESLLLFCPLHKALLNLYTLYTPIQN